MMQVTRNSLFSTANGGDLHITIDGEVVGVIHLPPGETRAADYLDRLPEGAVFAAGKAVSIIPPRSFYGRQAYGDGSHDSGANPDFKPTSADRMQREMRLTLNRMQAATARVEARERQLGKIERIPQAKPQPASEAAAEASDDDTAVVE